MIIKLITIFLPWILKRMMLKCWFGFKLDRNAYIGFSWVFPRMLIMKSGCRIDHFNVAINLDRIDMEENSSIGRGNWITGFPTDIKTNHFKHQPNRKAELIIRESAAITKNHHFDCTNVIEIGKFSTIAGYDSQFLTHSIDIVGNYQDSAPISIGEYSFVGTNVVILLGSKLPSYSVLGAKSLLNKEYSEEWYLYVGVPAKPLKEISKDAKYFTRTKGIVY